MLITTHQDNVWTIKLQMKYIQNSKPLHFKRESTPASGGRTTVLGPASGGRTTVFGPASGGRITSSVSWEISKLPSHRACPSTCSG